VAARPSRIDLLELDIDLRMADLWRDITDLAVRYGWTEKQITTLAAYCRAAYGKGYWDALTEDGPGSLCLEHGYRVPSNAYHLQQCTGFAS